MKHTATHTYTLQRTATHCNSLHCIATHSYTLQLTAPHCNTSIPAALLPVKPELTNLNLILNSFGRRESVSCLFHCDSFRFVT